MMIEFKLDDFEGPLDLLLHLIKENKMDIFDIPIEEITKQYLAYIQNVKNRNLEVASAYLVMASELIELKAKMLLPRQQEDDQEPEEDPREELVGRLLEYQAYKEISKDLKQKELKRQEIYTKLPEDVRQYQENTTLAQDGSIDDLVDALKKFLARKQEEVPLQTKVTMKEITVSSRKIEIRQKLNKEKKMRFFDLFPVASKEYLVATFLAVLEMAKSKELLIFQDTLFADIICEVVEHA